MSTQSTQPVSLTSFIQTTNDFNTGASGSQRQTRQSLLNNENQSTWQRRTRYGRQITTHQGPSNAFDSGSHRTQSLPITNGSSRIDAESDDDDDDDNDGISSNGKRHRIERSDRRIASIQRPNYRIDSDEHEDENEEQNVEVDAVVHNEDESKPVTEQNKSKQKKAN